MELAKSHRWCLFDTRIRHDGLHLIASKLFALGVTLPRFSENVTSLMRVYHESCPSLQVFHELMQGRQWIAIAESLVHVHLRRAEGR